MPNITSMARRGPLKGSKFCDLIQLLQFLGFIRKDQPTNVYRIYHGPLRWDTKKIYRYLRYAMKLGLIKLDHIDKDKFLPAKYYILTPLGTALMNVGIPLSPRTLEVKT